VSLTRRTLCARAVFATLLLVALLSARVAGEIAFTFFAPDCQSIAVIIFFHISHVTDEKKKKKKKKKKTEKKKSFSHFSTQLNVAM
jgi:hypothetical protein